MSCCGVCGGKDTEQTKNESNTDKDNEQPKKPVSEQKSNQESEQDKK